MTPTTQPASQTGKYLTPTATAAILDVHVETVRRWLRNGKLDALHIGRKWFISPAIVKAMKGQDEVLK